MINYLLLTSASTIFARVLIDKTDLKNKIFIALIIGISLTTALTIIQVFIDFILNFLFSLF